MKWLLLLQRVMRKRHHLRLEMACIRVVATYHILTFLILDFELAIQCWLSCHREAGINKVLYMIYRWQAKLVVYRRSSLFKISEIFECLT